MPHFAAKSTLKRPSCHIFCVFVSRANTITSPTIRQYNSLSPRACLLCVWLYPCYCTPSKTLSGSCCKWVSNLAERSARDKECVQFVDKNNINATSNRVQNVSKSSKNFQRQVPVLPYSPHGSFARSIPPRRGEKGNKSTSESATSIDCTTAWCLARTVLQ